MRLTSCLKSLLLTQSKGGGAAGFVTSTGDRVLLPHGPQDRVLEKKPSLNKAKLFTSVNRPLCQNSGQFCFVLFVLLFVFAADVHTKIDRVK